MDDLGVILLFIIVVILWRSTSKANEKFDQLREEITAQNYAVKIPFSIKGYLDCIERNTSRIDNATASLVDIATQEHPAGINSFKFVRSENLAKIYAEHLENSDKKMPSDLALKQARFEIAEFGEEKVIEKMDSSTVHRGLKYQKEQKAKDEFFSSGILEEDIENYLRTYYVCEDTLFAPLYRLIVKTGYAGEEFTASVTPYPTNTYEEMIEIVSVISKLEQMGVIIRTKGENWGDLLIFKLTTTDKDKLKDMVYSGDSSHDDEFFEEQFEEGEIPEIFAGMPIIN